MSQYEQIGHYDQNDQNDQNEQAKVKMSKNDHQVAICSC